MQKGKELSGSVLIIKLLITRISQEEKIFLETALFLTADAKLRLFQEPLQAFPEVLAI